MKNILLLILFFTYLIVNGQVIKIAVPAIVNDAAYIFEGTVIRSDSYWATQERMIYTSHTVQISKIFKGNITCGTIEIITEGGVTPDMQLTISHNLELRVGDQGLFFCQNTPVEVPQIDYYSETNTQVVSVIYGEQGFFTEYDDVFNKEVSNLFYSFDSLAQAYDVVELLTQLNYIDCQATIVSSPLSEMYRINPMPKATIVPKKSPNEYVENLLRQKMESGISLKTQTTTLKYTFENVQITGVSPRYLECDIYLSADDNNSYLDNGAVSVYYDTTVFGTNIYTNNGLTVTRGTMLASAADYKDPDSLTTDNGIGVFNVILYARNNPSNRYNVTTTATQAIHLKMEFNNCKIPSVIGFTNHNLMVNFSLYTTTSNAPTSSFIQYANVTDSDYEDLPVCYPQITDFNPKIVRGGIGEMVTITGKFLGQAQGSGRVYLKNADNGGNTFIELDSLYDYILWNDSSIIITIPSLNYHIGGSGSNVAGSGPIRIQTGDGDSTSTYFLAQTDIKVDYSIINREANPPTNRQKKQLDLMDPYGSQFLGDGGYLFQFADNLTNKPMAFKTVKKAINDWRCLTHVHFEAGDTLKNWTKIKESLDSLNVIQFGKTPTNSASLMATKLWTNSCLTLLNPFPTEIDIIIKDTTAWSIDTTFGNDILGIGMYDFYAAILHEFGHAHCLNHVNDTTEVMYYTSLKGPIPAAKRRITLSSSCFQGGNTVINHSATTLHGNCFAPLNNMTLISGFNCTTPIEESVINDIVTIYPNPTKDIFTIDFANLIGKYNLSIVDIVGKPIFIESSTIEKYKSINISHLTQGLYYIVIVHDSSTFNFKLIKQ